VASWSKPKDPDAVLDYQFNWSDWLQEDETIVESIFIVEGSSTLVLDRELINGGFTEFWAAGGENGDIAKITNRITSSEGRVDDDTCTLRIRSSR
jgi:hypothetical protein